MTRRRSRFRNTISTSTISSHATLAADTGGAAILLLLLLLSLPPISSETAAEAEAPTPPAAAADGVCFLSVLASLIWISEAISESRTSSGRNFVSGTRSETTSLTFDLQTRQNTFYTNPKTEKEEGLT